MDGLRYSPDDPSYRLGPVHTCVYVRVRETGDWDLFLGPLEWARAETGGADRWVLKRRGFPGVARVNKVTPMSLGYPLSVFNKNSTITRLTLLGTTPRPRGGSCVPVLQRAFWGGSASLALLRCIYIGKYTMPPKPAMMAAWLEKAKEGESGTVIMIHSPTALATLRYEAVRSSAMLV